MALEITWFAGYDRETGLCYGRMKSSVSYTVTASSVTVGTVPSGAKIARCKAGEICRVSNNGTAASATNGVHLGVGEVIDLEVTEANGLLAITST
jgi:hypothetical protein